MAILDKMISAVTPPESDEKRREAHAKARACAEPGDWLSVILDHHEGVEAAFAAVKAADGAEQRLRALKRLGTLLNGHSMAEEATVYPAIADADSKMSANTAYTEQVAAKMQLAALELMDPMGKDFLDKFGHLEGAVLHHVYKEESEWFPDLKRKANPALQAHVTQRYLEEYDRYMGEDAEESGMRLGEARSFTGAAQAPQPPQI
ncbi:MAG TPA: hemerythrin domain-containing protein [Caulobacteraceae bacterium]|nr:hemerythrin domain-containing protein [Caulobacteraceae bacterium]